MIRKILIVKAGGWGQVSAEAGDYDVFIGIIEESAKKATTDSMTLEVTVVNSEADAVKLVSNDRSYRFYAVIFLTRGLLQEAKRMKELLNHQRANTKVIVFTGLMPEEDVIVVSKSWVGHDNLIEAILLFS